MNDNLRSDNYVNIYVTQIYFRPLCIFPPSTKKEKIGNCFFLKDITSKQTLIIQLLIKCFFSVIEKALNKQNVMCLCNFQMNDTFLQLYIKSMTEHYQTLFINYNCFLTVAVVMLMFTEVLLAFKKFFTITVTDRVQFFGSKLNLCP